MGLRLPFTFVFTETWMKVRVGVGGLAAGGGGVVWAGETGVGLVRLSCGDAGAKEKGGKTMEGCRYR